MASTFYEIIELSSGEIALQRVDGNEEPLVRISLSDEVKSYLQDQYVDVAKAMINAGVRAFGQLQDEPGYDHYDEDSKDATIH